MKGVVLVASAAILAAAVMVVASPAGAQSKAGKELSSARSASEARLSSGPVFFSRELIGRAVTSREDEQLGTIENLVISRNGQVTCIILAPAKGVMTKGQFAVIPWETADPELRHDKVVINLTPRRLQDAPAVSSANIAPSQTTQTQRQTNGYYGEADTGQPSLEKQGEWDKCQIQTPLETEPEYGVGAEGREGAEPEVEKSEDGSFDRTAGLARSEACYPNHFCTGLGGYDLGMPSWSRMAAGFPGSGSGLGGYEVGLIGQEAPIQPAASSCYGGYGISPGFAAGYGAPCFGSSITNDQSEMRTNLTPHSTAAELPEIFGGLVPGVTLGSNVGTKDLIGMPVQNRHGVQLSAIVDLLLNQRGEIKYLVLSNPNIFEAGGRDLSAVSWDAVQPLIRGNAVVVNLSQSDLNNAYHFSRNELRKFRYSKNWQGLSGYYGGAVGGPSGGFRANALIGEVVANPQGDELGVIKDLFANESGCLKYAILSPAENLNFGSDQLMAIPWSLVQPLPQGGATINISPYSLMNAPRFSRENWQNYVNNPQFDRRVFTYFGTTPGGGIFGSFPPSVGMTGLVSALQVVGQDVANTQGQPLGTLRNLITSDDGQVRYLLVSPQQEMNQRIAIPWIAAAPRFEPNAVVVDIARNRFTRAPSFSGDELQQMNSPQWQARVNRYFREEIQSHQKEGYGNIINF